MDTIKRLSKSIATRLTRSPTGLTEEEHKTPCDIFTDSGLAELGISVIPLDLNAVKRDPSIEHGPYFKPWSLDYLNKHPIDMTDSHNSRNYESAQRALRQIDEGPEGEGHREADTLCSELAQEFYFQREGLLNDLRGWGTSDAVDRVWGWFDWCAALFFLLLLLLLLPAAAAADSRYNSDQDNHFLLERFEVNGSLAEAANPLIPDFTEIVGCYRSYIAGTIDEMRPHVLFVMAHRIDGSPDEYEDQDEEQDDGFMLLRTEVLNLIGVMITRLKTRRLRGYNVVPIQAISIFEDWRARILQAYMKDDGCGGGELVIAMSKVYDFRTQERCDENFPIFLCHMASEPVGDTKGLRYGLPTEEKGEDGKENGGEEERSLKGRAWWKLLRC
ncbi:hypothetical protein BDW74DRAFT_175212 [Aspergillus multicolor]|uniref:uncharacterized protein n=1 Tax=Aspergillus multicolor TaxID=41759 RepID=UPI003CCC9311